MLRHFHGLYSHRPQLSTNQRARIRSVIVKTVLTNGTQEQIQRINFTSV